KATTSTAVSSSANTAVSGQSVTFTATIAVIAPGGGTPSGTVQFLIDGSNAGNPANVSSVGGIARASFSTASLATGGHTIAASYSGDGSFPSSTANILTQTVAQAATSTVLSSSNIPSVTGQSVSFTATVNVVAPGAGIPSGTVQFRMDGTNLGSPVTPVSGVA